MDGLLGAYSRREAGRAGVVRVPAGSLVEAVLVRALVPVLLAPPAPTVSLGPAASDTIEVSAFTGLDVPPVAMVLPVSALTMFTGYTTPPGGAHEDGAGGPGSGNQTYLGGIGLGAAPRLTALFGISVNDDPTYAPVRGQLRPQYHVDVGLGARLLLVRPGPATVAVQAAAEWLWISSAPALFNAGTERGKARFPAFALDVPVTLRPTRTVFVTLVPSVAHLPASVIGAPYFGTMVRLGARFDARIAESWSLWGSGEVPFGPGETSIDRNGDLERRWTWRAGVRFHAAERVTLDGTVTNASGGSAATRHLTALGAPVTLYTLNLRYAPTEPETPGSGPSAGTRTSAAPGITVPGSATLASGRVRVAATVDAVGSGGAQVTLGMGRRFHFELLTSRIRGPDAPAIMEAPIGSGLQYRFGPQVQVLDQAEGADLTLSGRVTVGRDIDDQQGYLLAEAVASRGFGSTLEITVDPLVIESGGRSLASVGVGARIGVGPVVLLPEGRGSFTGERPLWALGLRLPTVGRIQADLFLSNAGSTLGLGRVLPDPAGARVGLTMGAMF